VEGDEDDDLTIQRLTTRRVRGGLAGLNADPLESASAQHSQLADPMSVLAT